jgi:RNA polymerase sigma-70 factor (ECF subfamily)
MKRLNDLLAQQDRLASLARSLVRDPDLAEDVAQEAWLVALRRPEEAQRLRYPWMARVVAHVARNRRRARERALKGEREKPAAAAVPSTASVVEAVELQRLLADAVLQLAEPYRETVILRYFGHLAPRHIARRCGVPVATVRTRLARALAMLRRRLDARCGGDRRAWAAIILRGLPIGGSCARIMGALVMKKKLAAAAACLVALIGGGAILLQGRPQGETGAIVAREHAERPLAPSDGASPAATFIATAPFSDEEVEDAETLPPRSPVRVVVRDTQGRPVPGANVLWIDDGLWATGSHRLRAARARILVRDEIERMMHLAEGAKTDGDGAAEILLTAQGGSVLAMEGGRAGTADVRGSANESVVYLEPLTLVEVLVRHEDGSPAAGIPVVLEPGESRAGRRGQGRGTSALPDGRVVLRVLAEATASQGPWRVALDLPLNTDLRIVMEPAPVLAGRVRLPEGMPARRIMIALWNHAGGKRPPFEVPGWALGTLDADGSFAFEELREGVYDLAVSIEISRTSAVYLEGIVVRPGTNRDPRADPLDLSQRWDVLQVAAWDAQGRALLADLRLIHAGRRVDSCRGSRPFVVARDPPLEKIVVSAEGFVPVTLPPFTGRRDVVLQRSLPVRLRLAGIEPPPKPLRVEGSLLPVGDSSKRSSGRRAPLLAGGTLDLEVAGPGRYRLHLEVALEGYVIFASFDGNAPIVTVDAQGNATPSGIPLDPAVLESAVQSALERQKKRRGGH